jgi:PAT family beta-lactamase induction signal transducer AmpG
MAYAVSQGLMYGTRTAIFMDVTNPKVAATQFTAYMAMMNLAISYSSTWQGISAEVFGYPTTLLIDAISGPLCVLLLPWIVPSKTPEGDGGGAGRARILAAVLAAGCLAWVPYRLGYYGAGPAQPMFETLFTLIFVASAVFLAAGAATLGPDGGRLARAGLVLAPLLLAMYVRKWFPQAGWLYLVVPVVGAAVLVMKSRLNWQVLRPVPA